LEQLVCHACGHDRRAHDVAQKATAIVILFTGKAFSLFLYF
jgi:uncharacterized protein (DUF983 family)